MGIVFIGHILTAPQYICFYTSLCQMPGYAISPTRDSFVRALHPWVQSCFIGGFGQVLLWADGGPIRFMANTQHWEACGIITRVTQKRYQWCWFRIENICQKVSEILCPIIRYCRYCYSIFTAHFYKNYAVSCVFMYYCVYWMIL